MKKINFEAGTQVSPAKVTIDNIDHEVTPAVWEGNTPLSTFVLNKMQDNIEEETKTTQTTEISEELTINNCAGVKGKLDIVSGKSEQATRSGKNKYNATINKSVNNVSSIADIQYFTLNGTSSADGRVSFRLQTLKAGTYTVNLKYISGSYSSSANYSDHILRIWKGDSWDAFGTTIDVNSTDKSQVSMTFTLEEDTEISLGAFYRVTDIYNNIKYAYQIVEGSNSDFDFEPYGVSPSPDYPSRIRNVGDNINIFDKDNEQYILKNTYLNGSAFKIDSYTGTYSIALPIKPNTTYTIYRGLGTKDSYRVATSNNNVLNSSINNLSAFIDTKYYSITTSSDSKYLIIWYYCNNKETYTEEEIRNSIKIEEGLIPTPYTPYNCGSADFKVSNEDNSQSRIVSFPFTAGQVLHKGDYLASNGTHHKRKTLVLTGTETITEVSNNRFQIALPLKAGDGYQKIISLCSHFKSITQLDIISTTNNNVVAANGNYVYFRVNSEETLDNFKNRLAEQYANGTPVTIEYELAEEIVIPYTTEQEQAYYELQHLLMYEGYTNITCIDEIKPDIQGTYYFNNELNKSYGERFDEVEDSINELEEEINNNNTKITTIESDINSLEANKLTSKGTNSTQGSWQSVPLDYNDHFVILVISGTNYTDWKILPKSLIKKYTPSSTLKIIHNGTTIVQIAWNANSMVEYIWTTGYTITHYTY